MSSFRGYIPKFWRRIFELNLTPAELSVYLILRSHDFNLEHPGLVSPSIAQIRQHVKASKQVVSDALWTLNDMGLISIIPSFKKAGKISYMYRLEILDDETDKGVIEFIKCRIPRARQTAHDKKANRRPAVSVPPQRHVAIEEVKHIGFEIGQPALPLLVNQHSQQLVSQGGCNSNKDSKKLSNKGE